jgi:uncharacterized protein YeaO (DUF488 family)
MAVALKRAYEEPLPADGTRVLVDRLWPRGIKKEDARIDHWFRDVAPSNELRKWFHERPSMWRMFRERYLQELSSPLAEAALESLHELAAKKRRLTLVFSSRNEQHNNAVVLKELIEGMKKPPHKVKREPAAQAQRAQMGRG